MPEGKAKLLIGYRKCKTSKSACKKHPNFVDLRILRLPECQNTSSVLGLQPLERAKPKKNDATQLVEGAEKQKIAKAQPILPFCASPRSQMAQVSAVRHFQNAQRPNKTPHIISQVKKLPKASCNCALRSFPG
jgi:hypothetical protein